MIWLTCTLPGNVITFGIDSVVGLVRGLGSGRTDSTAKIIEQLMALALFVVIGVLFGGVVGSLANRSAATQTPRPARWRGVMAGLILFVVVAGVEWAYGIGGSPVVALVWLALLLVGWGTLLGDLVQGTAATVEPDGRRYSRRQVLLGMTLGSLGAVLVAWGVEQLLGRPTTPPGADQPSAALPNLPASPTPTTPAADTTALRDSVVPAPGTRPEITPNDEFYRIDINLRPPEVDGSTWMLETAGLFDNPHSWTLDDLMALPAVTQPLTLSCISNPIGGDLISASRWTGVRLRDVMKEMGLQPAAKALAIKAVDGFYESVPLDEMMDPQTLLVYGMNGKMLPIEHGFPLRIYIPNHYGMKQPKWITHIEAIDTDGPGYWVDRGWSATAIPHIISMIDTVAQDAVTDEGRIPIGGIAWAGNRGIKRVEVQVDDGDWAEATLRTPPLSDLIWVQWRYDWPSGNRQAYVPCACGFRRGQGSDRRTVGCAPGWGHRLSHGDGNHLAWSRR